MVNNPVILDGILQDLPHYALTLSILFTEWEKYEPLLLHSFIVPSFHTTTKRFENPTYHEMQIRRGAWPLQYESYTLPYALCVDGLTTISPMLFELIRHHRYCRIHLHTDFLPFASPDPVEEPYQYYLVSGYSDDKHTIFLNGIHQNQVFMKQEVDVDAFLSSLIPPENRDLVVHVLKKNDAFHEALDPHRLQKDLSCFLESQNSPDTPYNGTALFGVAAIKAFEKQLQVEADTQTGPILESMVHYSEHKVMMHYRMKRLLQLGMIQAESILQNYDSIVMSTKKAVEFYRRYRVRQEKEDLDRAIAILKANDELEITTIELAYGELRHYEKGKTRKSC